MEIVANNKMFKLMLEKLSLQNTNLTAQIISVLKTPTPVTPPIIKPTPVDGPPKIIDVTKCDPTPRCWLMYGALGSGEQRKSGDIKKIIWDQNNTSAPQ